MVPRRSSRQDFLWAAAAGGVALVVYMRTLAPGLVGVLDTPMFQFIGRVFGVAHNPGYPLYVLLTYPFSFLPVGSLAYRINLFSALLGALTVSLAFLIARRLGCETMVSLAAALGLAFGQVFWSQAVIAEVYTLHAAIVAGVLLMLVAWRHTRRQGFYFAALALFAAGLGNHTTVVGFLPGIAIYVLLTDRRFAIRPRTLAMAAAILAAGLLQYGFIILRSRHPGAYVESRATTIADLVDVMLAAQFKERLFAFAWRDVLVERLPSLVEHVLVPELTIPGLAFATVGIVWLLRHHLAEGLLLLLGGAAIVGFAANYAVVDTPVFLIPTILVLWLFAAVGAEQAIRFAVPWPWALMLGAVTLSVPAYHLAHNFARNDRSRDTKFAVYLDALFRALPNRAALVHEDFLVDRMVMFKLLGERAAGGRRIDLVDRDPEDVRARHADGLSVFAFGKSARRLRYEALNISFAPLPLTDGSLGAFLSDLADGTIVALAVLAGHAQRFTATHVSLAEIGGPDELASNAPSNVALIGVRGARRGASVQTGSSDLRLSVASSQEIGETGFVAPEAIEIHSTATEAAIRQGSRDVVRTSAGAAMAIWSPDGKRQGTFVLQADGEFRVPLLPGPLSLYPLRGTWSSHEVQAKAWTDAASAFRTGSAMVRVPGGQNVVFYLGDDERLAPRVIDKSSERVKIGVARLEGHATDRLRTQLEAEQVKSVGLTQVENLYRIEMTTSGAKPVSVLLALGGVPAHAIGRMNASPTPRTAELFSVETDGLLRTADRHSEVLLMARDDQAQLTGDGWSAVDWDAVSPYRWMTRTEARFLLPIAKGNARRLKIQALLAEKALPTRLGLRLNGAELPAQPLRVGWHTYEWTVPLRAISAGITDAVLTVDRLATRTNTAAAPKEIAITEVRVIHDEDK